MSLLSRTDSCRSVTRSTASQGSWRPLCLTPGVSVTCLCSVHVQHQQLSPRNRTILSFVYISQQAYLLSLSLQTRMVSTDQRLPVPLLCHIQHSPSRTNAVPRLHFITGLSLSPDPNRFGQVTILCSEQTGAFQDLSCSPHPPPPPHPPKLSLSVTPAPTLRCPSVASLGASQDAAVPGCCSTSHHHNFIPAIASLQLILSAFSPR